MKAKLEIQRINERIVDFTEVGETNRVDAYLVLGDERALLVDSLTVEVGLVEAIRGLTDLPVTVAITHGHGDHAGAEVGNLIAAGCDVHMAPVDVDLLTRVFGAPEECRAWYKPLAEGDVFDLGGIRLETIAVPGHTPGSVVFYEPEKKWLFSGDTVGSGAFWMQISGCTPLHVFADSLDRLIGRVGAGEDLLIYPGHRYQSPVQLTGPYLEDARFITRGILAGEIRGREDTYRLGGRELHCRVAAHGLMRAYSFDPENL